MQRLETRIHPPFVLLAAIAIIHLGEWLLPGLSGAQTVLMRALMWAFLVAGAIFGAFALAQVVNARTTVHPTHPDQTTALVTSGIYGLTRNPMYLGLACFLVAYGFHKMHPAVIVALAFFIWFITRFQIVPEERALRRKFGKTFDDYAARVRRWI